jgi:hypothetical protein
MNVRALFLIACGATAALAGCGKKPSSLAEKEHAKALSVFCNRVATGEQVGECLTNEALRAELGSKYSKERLAEIKRWTPERHFRLMQGLTRSVGDPAAYTDVTGQKIPTFAFLTTEFPDRIAVSARCTVELNDDEQRNPRCDSYAYLSCRGQSEVRSYVSGNLYNYSLAEIESLSRMLASRISNSRNPMGKSRLFMAVKTICHIPRHVVIGVDVDYKGAVATMKQSARHAGSPPDLGEFKRVFDKLSRQR